MSSVKEKLVGTWQLVYSVEIDSAGNKKFPFGDDAIGTIIYDANGRMAVQICRRERNAYEVISKDYLAYFGRYEVDEKQELVRHFIMGHLSAQQVGKIFERKYHFFEDKLSLRPWNDGTDREILWQKIFS